MNAWFARIYSPRCLRCAAPLKFNPYRAWPMQAVPNVNCPPRAVVVLADVFFFLFFSLRAWSEWGLLCRGWISPGVVTCPGDWSCVGGAGEEWREWLGQFFFFGWLIEMRGERCARVVWGVMSAGELNNEECQVILRLDGFLACGIWKSKGMVVKIQMGFP